MLFDPSMSALPIIVILWITDDYHDSVPVTRHGRVIIISIHGIMHLWLIATKMQVESAHARDMHAVAQKDA